MKFTYPVTKKKYGEFLKDLENALLNQFESYEIYRKLCKFRGIEEKDLEKIVHNGELWYIPSIPASFFKIRTPEGKRNDLVENLANKKKPGEYSVSSSTSGNPSYVYRTSEDEEVSFRSYKEAFSKAPDTDIGLMFCPELEFMEYVSKGRLEKIDDKEMLMYALIGARAAAEKVREKFYMLKLRSKPKLVYEVVRSKLTGSSFTPLYFSKNDFLTGLLKAEEEGKSILLGGSVLVMYPAVLELKKAGKKFKLDDRVYVITGAGGWDGVKGNTRWKPINKSQFVRDLSEVFDIPPEEAERRFIDNYGTTEDGMSHSGYFSKKLGDFIFEVAEGMKLYLLKPNSPLKNPEVIKNPDEPGIPLFISPYGKEGHAGVAIEQGDLIEAISFNDDYSVRKFTGVRRATDRDRGHSCAFGMIKDVRI
ncbi:MAG: hypothetical protein J7K72_01150 [Candidatus Aenigmarchaeota archaeon]|nr:hypothetical protein [Candidatus Aenigmarchaeota archaeon]